MVEQLGAGGQISNAERIENFPGFPQGLGGHELGPLLHQVQLGHSLRLAFKFCGGNAHQFAQHVSRIIKSKRLIKVTGKKITFQRFIAHMNIRFTRERDGQ